MKKILLKLKAAKMLSLALTFGTLFFLLLATVNAQTTTFAQFLENNGSQDFVFTNNSSSATFNAVSGGSSISFRYQNISNLPPSLQGFQDAHLTVTTTTTQTATNNSGTLTQPFDQVVTVHITRDTPAPAGVGSGARTNLLTAVISPSGSTPGLVGSGNSATVSATTPDHVVTFTSDFLIFTLTTQRNLAFSFSSVTPTLAIGSGNFLQSFTAAATGTFASSPPPIYASPTAARVNISGRVLTPNGAGLQNARVIMTEQDGTVRTATTTSFGYYHFDGVQSGQNVIMSVSSKRYSFDTQLVSLQDDLGGFDFYAFE